MDDPRQSEQSLDEIMRQIREELDTAGKRTPIMNLAHRFRRRLAKLLG
jgi:hypothetical protein